MVENYLPVIQGRSLFDDRPSSEDRPALDHFGFLPWFPSRSEIEQQWLPKLNAWLIQHGETSHGLKYPLRFLRKQAIRPS